MTNTNENSLREARTRAAIRVARRLGAGADELHDVMLAMRSGWNPEVDKYLGEEIGEVLRDTCDEEWQKRREPYAPARSRRVLELLGEMWPDEIAECGRERQPELGSVSATNYVDLARYWDERGETDRAALYREAAAVMAKVPPSSQ